MNKIEKLREEATKLIESAKKPRRATSTIQTETGIFRSKFVKGQPRSGGGKLPCRGHARPRLRAACGHAHGARRVTGWCAEWSGAAAWRAGSPRTQRNAGCDHQQDHDEGHGEGFVAH